MKFRLHVDARGVLNRLEWLRHRQGFDCQRVFGMPFVEFGFAAETRQHDAAALAESRMKFGQFVDINSLLTFRWCGDRNLRRTDHPANSIDNSGASVSKSRDLAR